MPHSTAYNLSIAAALAFCAMGAHAQVASDMLTDYVADCMQAFEADIPITDLDGFERVSEDMLSKTYPALTGARLQAEPRVVLEQTDSLTTCSLASFDGAVDDVKLHLPDILDLHDWTFGSWMPGRYPQESRLTLSKQDAIILVQLTDQRGLFAGITMYKPGT